MTNSKTCTGFTTLVARRILLFGTLLLAAAASAEMSSEQLRERLQMLIPGHTPDLIRPSPSPGLYEVLYGADIFYITSDGKHLFTGGHLIDVDSRINLTEISRAEVRARLLDAYGTDKMLVFPATTSRRHSLVVVTDIDCPYCQRFHDHIEELNNAGIEVRYLLYPRAGEESESYRKSVSVWCSDDPLDALTRAKRQESVPPKTCANPVLEHIDLVNRINILSTPSIFLSDGSLIRGYRPPAEILALLGD